MSNNELSAEDIRYCKRQAIHVAAQLPENPVLAGLVLAFAGELVEDFLGGGPPQTATARPALKLVGSDDPA